MALVASIRQTSYFPSVSFVTRLGPSDHHAALELVSEAAATNEARPFEPPTIESLLRMIPAERAGYFEYSDGGIVCGSGTTYLVDEPADADPIDWGGEVVYGTVASWPLRDCPARAGSLAVKLSDFLTGSRLRRNPWYSEVMRGAGAEHELKVWLPAPAGTYRGFFFVRARESRDFDERDRAVLDLLRPHLALIRDRWERRRRPSFVTRREAEVLELLAQGLTNVEIANRLVISRATVRTHLENIFEKLGVHTRTAAVARFRDATMRG